MHAYGVHAHDMCTHDMHTLLRYTPMEKHALAAALAARKSLGWINLMELSSAIIYACETNSTAMQYAPNSINY